MGIVEWLIGMDHALFFRLNGMSVSPVVAGTARLLSDYGWIVMVLSACAVMAAGGWRPFRSRAAAVLLVSLLAMATNYGLKEAVGRSRPLKYYEGAIARGAATIHAGERLKRKSFPSGHTFLAFYVMGYTAWLRRRHAWWALPLAAAVGWSRVAMGSHFPLDCLAGAVLGLFWAWAAWRLALYLERVPWMNRAATAPEPSSGSC